MTKTQLVFKSAKAQAEILAVYDSILQRWPVPYRSHLVPTPWGETFVLECGDSGLPPLVLLHGSASNSSMWVGDVAAFSSRYHVFAIDFPGETGKSEAIRIDLTGPACAEWMQAVFDALGISHVTLQGISLGGWLALKYATTFPEQVKKLVLLCPGGVSPEKGDFFLKALPYLFLGEWGSGQIMRQLNAGQPLHPETVHVSYMINRNFNPRRHGGPLFTDEELSRLVMPVLLLAGDKDILLDSFQAVARLKKLLPSVQIDLLPGAGHILVNLAGRIMPFLE
jgi:pimeloyl-ACP methyl ester carboxylesterase